MTGSLPIPLRDGERILLVDDNEAARYAKSRILRQAGYTVIEAASGSEAVPRIVQDDPDLILLDVRLPDMSGLDVCRRIKENPGMSAIPVLQISASFCDDRSIVAGLENGADGYIAEPIEPVLLIATVAAFLRLRKAERAVREHALEWQTTFDAIADGVALVDTEGKIVRSNRALASLLNRPAAELIGAHFDELLPPPGEASQWQSLRSGERRREERPVDGRVFSVTIDPVCGHHGPQRGAVSIVCDVTEQKMMDERLWHTQKLESIGVLAGGVAHDFNNLLTGILGNATLALGSIANPRFVERALRDITGASERAADLTRQLLAYSGKGRVVVQPVDVSRLVSGIVPLVKASFPRKVRLVLNLEAGLPAVEADKTQVEQVIMNLLINAAEAIGENAGAVEVTTAICHLSTNQRRNFLCDAEVRGDYVMLEVRDDGMGMDEATISRIFDPFFTTKFLGRGLGLSAVLGIVRGHKGAIRVDSAPGRGTTFELLFPSSHAVAAALPAARGERLASSGDRRAVLVVDDERIIRHFFKAALESHGYSAVTAKNGAEALRTFSKDPARFSVVLLDLVMPVMSGKDVLPRLLEIHPEARIVVTSGQVEEQVRRELAAWNIAGFVQKPCALEPFLHQIRSVAA